MPITRTLINGSIPRKELFCNATFFKFMPPAKKFVPVQLIYICISLHEIADLVVEKISIVQDPAILALGQKSPPNERGTGIKIRIQTTCHV
jgi:hypothetical protein